ncbi:hypothetical protein Ddc_12054 [Ditylenchus destructor]|nr:hypothetical protein Ddc_12054 [Ditylenchus destructor]
MLPIVKPQVNNDYWIISPKFLLNASKSADHHNPTNPSQSKATRSAQARRDPKMMIRREISSSKNRTPKQTSEKE